MVRRFNATFKVIGRVFIRLILIIINYLVALSYLSLLLLMGCLLYEGLVGLGLVTRQHLQLIHLQCPGEDGNGLLDYWTMCGYSGGKFKNIYILNITILWQLVAPTRSS